MGTTHSWAAVDGELNSKAGVTNVNFRNAPCDKPHNLCAQEGQKQIFYTRGTCVVREVKALFIERGWLDLNEPGAWCASHCIKKTQALEKIALDLRLLFVSRRILRGHGAPAHCQAPDVAEAVWILGFQSNLQVTCGTSKNSEPPS